MRYLTFVLASTLLAAVIMAGIGVVEPAPAHAATGGYVKKCGGGKIFLNAKEKRTFELHNKIRRNHDLKTFCVQPNLEKAARAHSKEMVVKDYFSHDSYNGTSFDQRLKNFGYTPDGYSYWTVGENIAYGSGSQGSPANIMNAWMNSTEHRHNILNGKFRQIGIGTYYGNFQGHSGTTMYTADFGNRY